MNEREKKLIFLLFGAAFIIVNIFLFTSYTEAKQKKKTALQKNAAELDLKKKEIEASDERISEVDWLIEHEPKKGTHADVRADLVNFTEKSAQKKGVSLKRRPSPMPPIPDEAGRYNTARVEVFVNAADPELYSWIAELQNPEESRSVTFLRIKSLRDDPHRVDCELVLTQWFVPAGDEETEEVTSN